MKDSCLKDMSALLIPSVLGGISGPIVISNLVIKQRYEIGLLC
jgi:hypothetical protein